MTLTIKPFAILLCGALASLASARDYHVAVTGDDAGDGSNGKPLKTIQAAAKLARPGDVITVHEGTYRERVDPPRGGESDARRITYQAAIGETVIIKGSEIVKGWKQVKDDLWMVTMPDGFFGSYNPYADLIHGDFIAPNKNNQHTGGVYLNGTPLIEAASRNELDATSGRPYWFGEVSGNTTTLWCRCKGMDPNEQTVEINVRQAVFYPSKEKMNYITVRGFVMAHAACNWAPPSAEQIGLIGTHWSKGWVIENNIISHARCVGITLGKFGDQFDNTYAMNSQGWEKGVREAIAYGWSKETVGHHSVSGNTISFCGQAGIVGSLGAVFSTVTGNSIHDIAIGQRFSGLETAGIKFHAPVDVVIGGNHIHRTHMGIWLDWMTQGTRVTGNLLHDNVAYDLFVEVSHGPIVVDNNLFFSTVANLESSSGGAYCHNLFAGRIDQRKETRQTPVFKNHSVEGMRLAPVLDGDERYYNNILSGAGLAQYDDRKDIAMAGNVFLNGNKPGVREAAPITDTITPAPKLIEKPDGWHVEITLDRSWAEKAKHPLVTTGLLGKAMTPDAPFENPDGSALTIDTDFLGNKRDASNPFPGPFEPGAAGKQSIRIWPKPSHL